MSQPFVGEIRLFAGSFAPAGWAICDGSLVAISQYETLFQLIGTTYGGDGQSTFALPDLRGRAPLHPGPSHVLGQAAGVETVTITTPSMPSHAHAAQAAATPTTNSPSGAHWSAQATAAYGPVPGAAALAPGSIGPAGGGQPHENMPPYLVSTYIISFFGIFPSQT
ncbi:phage tail protein [Microbacterium sp. ASV49]|uniref:Tail fiber protein n=1 Tax=Microbacterium candidum TaxID=3041922 RepID=A0ABT7MYL4_9MICO|nr:tail fiber protein [Microbacterium sp. ASV49]MDL9979515.1 tail fiber protein [Microbacterium sp. ASV49]